MKPLKRSKTRFNALLFQADTNMQTMNKDAVNVAKNCRASLLGVLCWWV